MEEKKTASEWIWISGLIVLIIVLLLSRGMVWLLPTVVFPLALLSIGYYFWKNATKTDTPADEDSQDIQLLIDNCQLELEKIEAKKDRIQNSQKELRQKIQQRHPPLEAALLQKTKTLLEKYVEQAQLLAAKEEFYLDMHERVSTLQANHTWKLKLAAKQRELESLQDEHYEEVDKMENMKQDVAYSTGFFTAVRELSQEISESASALDIQQLKQELERLIPK